MTNLNELENAILRAAFGSSDGTALKLRKQLEILQVKARDFSGVGFFTEFCPVSAEKKLEIIDFEITDIDGNSDNIKNGFGCLVFVKNGQIDMIECFTYDEPWPDQLGTFKIQRTGCSGDTIV